MRKTIELTGEELRQAIADYLKERRENIRIIHVASIIGNNKTTLEVSSKP